jgi:hypothetical protein
LEETAEGMHHGREIKTMKYPASFTAAAILLGVAALPAAAAGSLRSSHLGEATAIQVAQQTSTGGAPRVYCYNGVRGDQENLYRGWICVREDAAPTR